MLSIKKLINKRRPIKCNIHDERVSRNYMPYFTPCISYLYQINGLCLLEDWVTGSLYATFYASYYFGYIALMITQRRQTPCNRPFTGRLLSSRLEVIVERIAPSRQRFTTLDGQIAVCASSQIAIVSF